VHDSEDEDDLYFDFEDYLYQVTDVAQAEKEAKLAPKKKIQYMCTHWLQGLCHKGVLCEYLHYYDVRFIPICKFFMEGKCTNGSCTFQHVLPSSAKKARACKDFALGFCPRGPMCVDDHIKRDAPCLADFEDTKLFRDIVAAFDAFMQEHRAREVEAKKKYMRAPTVTKMLYERRGKKMRVCKNKA
jgi:hypothetical protein